MEFLQPTFKILFPILSLLFLFSCNQSQSSQKTELLNLESEAIKREFQNDTAFLADLMDSTFIELTTNGVKRKHDVLGTIYKNNVLNRENKSSIDSFKLVDPVVHLYDDAAVVTFIMYTYRTRKDSLIEKRTRFYDVWVKRNGKWKAVTWQASPAE